MPSAIPVPKSPGIRRLLITYAALTVVYSLSIQLYGPFLRSLVVCSTKSAPDAGFTGSAYCGDLHYVLSVAQAEEGRLVGMKLLVHGIAGPVLALLADGHGRRPVLLLGLAGFAVAFAMFSITASWPELSRSTSVIDACFLVEGATSAFDVVYLSMLADMTPDLVDRALAFSAYYMTSAFGEASARLLAAMILRRCLTSYAAVWAVLSTALCADVMLVCSAIRETLPAADKPKWSLHSSGRAVNSLAYNVYKPAELVVRNPFFRIWVVALSFTSLASGLSAIEASFTVATYGWRPGDLQAWTWPSKVLQMGSLSLLGPRASAHGAPPVVALVTAASCAVSVLQILAPFSPFALIGANLATSILAFGQPVTTAFLSSHFGAEQQAKVHAVTHFCSNLSTSFGIALFSRPSLFNPEARGWMAARPFALAALLACLGGALRVALVLCPRRQVSQVHAEELKV